MVHGSGRAHSSASIGPITGIPVAPTAREPQPDARRNDTRGATERARGGPAARARRVLSAAHADDVFDREHDEHLDAETLERALESLIETTPRRRSAAHSADGVMVAMPESIRLRRNPVLEARTGLDLIIPTRTSCEAGNGRSSEGAARYPVHPAGHPDLTLMVYALDLRENHGVVMILCVFLPPPASERRRRAARRSRGQTPVRPHHQRPAWPDHRDR